MAELRTKSFLKDFVPLMFLIWITIKLWEKKAPSETVTRIDWFDLCLSLPGTHPGNDP